MFTNMIRHQAAGRTLLSANISFTQHHTVQLMRLSPDCDTVAHGSDANTAMFGETVSGMKWFVSDEVFSNLFGDF